MMPCKMLARCRTQPMFRFMDYSIHNELIYLAQNMKKDNHGCAEFSQDLEKEHDGPAELVADIKGLLEAKEHADLWNLSIFIPFVVHNYIFT